MKALEIPVNHSHVPSPRVPAPYQTTAIQSVTPVAPGSKEAVWRAAKGRNSGSERIAARKATSMGSVSWLIWRPISE